MSQSKETTDYLDQDVVSDIYTICYYHNVQEVTILSDVSKMPGVTLRRNCGLLTLCWSQLTLLPGLRAGGREEPAGLERPVLAEQLTMGRPATTGTTRRATATSSPRQLDKKTRPGAT